MKKKSFRSKKAMQKKRLAIFGGILIALVVLLIVVGVVDLINGNDNTLTITADGHVHTADGQHLGSVEEIFGEGVTVSEDGHIHAEDGSHVGDLSELSLADDGHIHTEGEEHTDAEGEAE